MRRVVGGCVRWPGHPGNVLPITIVFNDTLLNNELAAPTALIVPHFAGRPS